MPFSRMWRRVTRRTALLSLIALACSGGEGGGNPSGPDDAANRPVGSIELTAGGSQTVAPALQVPAAPTLTVKSDRGLPLRGATVTLNIEGGRGTLDAASVITDANGTATFPRWVAPFTAGEFAVNAVATGPGGGTASVRVTASVTDVQQPGVTQTIPTTGGTFTVPANAPGIGGVKVEVPPQSFPSSTTFNLAFGAAPVLPGHLKSASPVVGINGGATVSDSIIYLTFPTFSPGAPGQVLRAFVLGADNTLIPLSTYQSTTSSITVGITDFKGQTGGTIPLPGATGFSTSTEVAAGVSADFGIRILIAFWTVPTTGTFESGFEMKKDNVAFVNLGSFAEPGGFCAGSTVAAGGWYRRLPSAREQFPPLMTPAETGNWGVANQLNPAIRLATELQKTYGYVGNGISRWKYDRLRQHDRAVWENVLYQIIHGRQPVYLAIYDAGLTTGHAILAYKADAGTGTVFVSDPNYPEDNTRFMRWNNDASLWAQFMASAKAGVPNNTPYVLFADATYLFRENKAHITGVIDSYNANGLLAKYPRAVGDVTLKSGTVVSINDQTTSINVQSRDKTVDVKFTAIGVGGISYKNITTGDSTPPGGYLINNTTVTPIPLQTGQNKIAIVLQKQNGTQFGWFDAKVLTVTRALPKLAFLTQPANAQVNAGITVNVGVVDEDGNPVAGVRALTLTLVGGASGAVLLGGGTFATIDGTVVPPILLIDKPGTGYTLQLSSPGLATVTSSPFNITAGGGTLSGRTIHAVTSAGLDGVAVVASNGMNSFTATSTASGDWTIQGVPDGTYTITASKTGFVSTSLGGQVMAAPTTVVETMPLAPNGTPGGVFGQIRNAVNAQLVTTLTTVEARSGMNATSGPIAFSQATSTGSYALPNLPAGVYTLTATNPAYTSTSRTGVVVGGGTAVQGPDLVMNPLTGGIVARAVFQWGAAPSDLDTHITGPAGSGRFWVYWSSRGNCAASPFVCLDVDDTNGNGPETVTITQLTPGVYRYYIYDFTNRSTPTSTALGSSGARVQFFVGSTLRNTFFVPSGAGNAWEVFSWDGTTVTPVNRLYTVSGTPQPARIMDSSEPRTAEEELRYLIPRQPAKPPK